jgi:hypothetical protein
MRSSFFLSSLMGSVLSSLMGFQMTLIFLHQAKQRWLDEEFLLSLKLDGLSPFKLDGIADDSDLLSSSQAEDGLMRSSFFLSSLMGSVLSSLMGLQMTLIFCHLAKQRWLDEEFLLSLKLDGLSPFKLDGIADDSDLLSSSQAEMA